MLIRVEELDGWKRKLVIVLPEDDVAKKESELYLDLSKRVEVPGFRKGKVPRKMLERLHSDAVEAEAIEVLMGEAYVGAIRESGLKPVCDPVVEKLESGLADDAHTFTATIEVQPEVDVSDYSGMEFTERIPKITDEDVVRAIDELREQRAELVTAGRPSVAGDFVIIDYVRLDDQGNTVEESKQSDFPYEVGRGGVAKELEEALTGASPGDEKKVTITYPDDYESDALSGKTISFDVTIKEVKEKKLPVLDDEFARTLGGIETLLDLRVQVRNSLEAEAKAAGRRKLQEDVINKLVEENPFELPECLVQDRLARMYARLTEGREETDLPDREEFDRAYREVVERQVKSGILLAKIAETNDVEVSEDDIKVRVGLLAKRQGREPEGFYDDLKGTDVLSQIEDDLWLEKVHALLIGGVTVTTEMIDLPQPSAEKDVSEAGNQG